MGSAYSLATRLLQVGAELTGAIESPGDDLAPAALAIARVEYPALDAAPYLRLLDEMGAQAGARVAAASARPLRDVTRVFAEYLYDEQGFRGNHEQYDDPRNSFLNEVLERRTGIPISLATVYLEVARRAGLNAEGINFPGHFLVRVNASTFSTREGPVVVDPFHGGALLTDDDCRQLLRQHVGSDDSFGPASLSPATRRQILVRTLANLKRLYVRMQSLPQARFVSSLLVSLDPSAGTEVRDRGLLAYHLEEFPAALHDLEAYLDLLPPPVLVGARAEPMTEAGPEPEGDKAVDEGSLIRQQVNALRRRIAGFN